MTDPRTIAELKTMLAAIDELRAQIDAALAVGNSGAATELTRALQVAVVEADKYRAVEGIVEALREFK